MHLVLTSTANGVNSHTPGCIAFGIIKLSLCCIPNLFTLLLCWAFVCWVCVVPVVNASARLRWHELQAGAKTYVQQMAARWRQQEGIK